MRRKKHVQNDLNITRASLFGLRNEFDQLSMENERLRRNIDALWQRDTRCERELQTTIDRLANLEGYLNGEGVRRVDDPFEGRHTLEYGMTAETLDLKSSDTLELFYDHQSMSWRFRISVVGSRADLLRVVERLEWTTRHLRYKAQEPA